MRLSPKALALTFGLLWALVMLVVGGLGLVFEDYGEDFLEAMADLYPFFEDEGGLVNVLIGAAWGLTDGLIGGWLLAATYNFFAARE